MEQKDTLIEKKKNWYVHKEQIGNTTLYSQVRDRSGKRFILNCVSTISGLSQRDLYCWKHPRYSKIIKLVNVNQCESERRKLTNGSSIKLCSI